MKRTTTMRSGRIVAIGATIAVTLLAVLPGAWSPALAQTAGTATATPTATSTTTALPTSTPRPLPTQTPLATPVAPTVNIVNEVTQTVSTTQSTVVQTNGVGSGTDDTVAVEVPAGALPAGAALSVGVITNSTELQSQVPPPPGTSLVLPIQIEATGADGQPITGNFNEPVTISIDIPDIGLSGNLTMAYWTGTQWIQVPTVITVNPSTGRTTLTATVDHFTVFAVLEIAPEAPVPADTGTGLTDSGSSDSNVALLILAVVGLATVAGLGARLAVRRSRIE